MTEFNKMGNVEHRKYFRGQKKIVERCFIVCQRADDARWCRDNTVKARDKTSGIRSVCFSLDLLGQRGMNFKEQ